MAEGGGVQAGNEREGAAVREVGASVRVSILPTAMQSCLNQVSPEPHTEPRNVWQVGEWIRVSMLLQCYLV